MDGNGNLVNGMKVELVRSDFTLSVTTREDGIYDFKDLKEKKYMMRLLDKDGTEHLLAEVYTGGRKENDSVVLIKNDCKDLRAYFDMHRALVLDAIV